jgi:hypothetical protein
MNVKTIGSRRDRTGSLGRSSRTFNNARDYAARLANATNADANLTFRW